MIINYRMTVFLCSMMLIIIGLVSTHHIQSKLALPIIMAILGLMTPSPSIRRAPLKKKSEDIPVTVEKERETKP